MSAGRFDDPSEDERFYARALSVLLGPSGRIAVLMRLCNLVYRCAMTFALGWLFAQVVDRRPPVTVEDAVLLSPSVVAGDPIRVSYSIKRNRTCETDVSWSIYDGAQEIHRFGPQHIGAPGLPGRERYTRAWTTPVNAAPGGGKLRVVLAFACPGNYLQALYPVTLILPDIPISIMAHR